MSRKLFQCQLYLLCFFFFTSVWGVGEADLSGLSRKAAVSRVVHQRELPPFYQAYPNTTICFSGLILILSGIIVFLLWNQFRNGRNIRKKMEFLEQEQDSAFMMSEDFRMTLNSIGDGLFVTDTNGFVTMMNSAACEMTGISRDELLGQPLSLVFRPVNSINGKLLDDSVARTMKEKRSIEFSEIGEFCGKSGKTVNLVVHSAPIRNTSGDIQGTVLLFHDETDVYRKRIEMEKTLNVLKQVADFIQFAYVITDSYGRIYFEFKEKTGYWGFENGKSIQAEKWVLKEDYPAFSEAWDSIINSKTDQFKIRYRSNYYGTMCYYQMFVTLYQDDGCDDRRYLCVIQNETESGELFCKIQDRNFLFQSILDVLPTCFHMKDVDAGFRFAMANQLWCKSVGADFKEVTGKTDYDIFDRATADARRAMDEKIVESNQPVTYVEELSLPDGKRMMQTSKTCIHLSDGRRFLVAVASDITEVTNLNALFKGVLDALPSMLFVKDAGDDFRYMFANPLFLTGNKILNANNVIGKTDFDIFAKNFAGRIREIDEEILRDGTPRTFVEEQTLPDGELSTFMKIKKPFVTPDGRTLLIGIATDISETAKAKRQSEEAGLLMRALLNFAPVGLFLKDANDDFRYLLWNQKLEEVTKIPSSLLIGKKDTEVELLREKSTLFQIKDEDVMSSPSPVTRLIKYPLEGECLHFAVTKVPLVMQSGKRYIFGTVVDLTAQIRLEESLQETVSRLNRLLNNEQIYNQCLSNLMKEDTYEASVRKSLADIGERCGADRCFITCAKTAEDSTDLNFEWVRPGFSPRINIWPKHNLFRQKEVLEFLDKDGYCSISDFNDFAGVRDLMRSVGGDSFDEQSVLICKIEDRNEFWGIIGVSYVRQKRKIAPELIDVLKQCGRFFLVAREHAKQKLEIDSSNYIRTMIFNNIRIPIFLFDSTPRMVNVNPAACKLVNKTEEEVLNQTCYSNFCGRSGFHADCPVRKCLETGKPQSFEFTVNGHDIQIAAMPILDENGKVVYVLENGFDMTEINAGHRRLTSAMVAAQAADRAKSNFIATMNHELRTPLNAVIGFSELLQDGGIRAEESAEYLQAINVSGKTLLNMINDILDMSKLDAGKFLLSSEKVDFTKQMEGIVQICRRDAGLKKIGFEVKIPPDLPEFSLDFPRVRQILLNLIGNAIKFTHVGRVMLEISFEENTPGRGTLKIKVSDTGIGIRAEFLPRVFEPFLQDDKIRGSRAYQGSGLGLAISLRLAQAMNGTILAESTEGVGSIFTFILNNVLCVRRSEFRKGGSTC